MFTRSSSYLKTNNVDPNLFIEGKDYTNSQLLYQIDNFNQWNEYVVTKYERRIDKISEDIYGDSKYAWLLLYMNRIDNNNIIRGIKLKYIPIDLLLNLITNL